jgi:hypothetical protein
MPPLVRRRWHVTLPPPVRRRHHHAARRRRRNRRGKLGEDFLPGPADTAVVPAVKEAVIILDDLRPRTQVGRIDQHHPGDLPRPAGGILVGDPALQRASK